LNLAEFAQGVGFKKLYLPIADSSIRLLRTTLEQFSNSRAVSGIEQGGFFLRKKPLRINGLPPQQLENCYSRAD
jgi:hypothetical protein